MTIMEALIMARKTIEKRRHWCPLSWAKRWKWGMDAGPGNCSSPDMRRWCGLGALHRIDDGSGTTWKAERLLDNAAETLFFDTVIGVNAGWRGHSRILKVYDLAIRIAKERQI